MYLQWLYTGELVFGEGLDLNDLHEKTDSRETMSAFKALIDLFQLGDSLDDLPFRNLMIDETLALSARTKTLMNGECIRRVYDG